jgi:hypothetical protein
MRTLSQWSKNGVFLTPIDDLPVVLKHDYLNFGGLIPGDVGYGIRDNGGTIQIKNDGGAWETPSTGGGEANTGTNLGAGVGVFSAKVGVSLQFRTLIAGTGVTFDTVADTITINSTGGGGGGDMAAATYDPTDVDGDAFDMDNMAESATKKILTSTERSAIASNTIDIAALANGMVYKGDWDASAGTFPGAGVAQIGWFYYVSVAGTVDGVAFAIGDNIVAITDDASASVYAGNWSKHDQTDAVQAVVGLTGSITKSGLLSALNVEDGADATDTDNVRSSGAVMDDELASIADVKALNQSVISGADPVFGIENMTLDDTDLAVVPVTNMQDFADGVDHSLFKARGTGVNTTYVSTVAIGGTTFAQPEVFGEIKSDQGYFDVHYTGATGVTVADLNSTSTYVYIDNANSLQQQTTIPTRQDWSRKVFTMRIGVNTSTNQIIGFEYLNNPLGNFTNTIRDVVNFLQAQGIPFKKDQAITGRTDNFGFDVSAGELLEFGGTGDIDNPNIKPFDAVANTAYNWMSRTALVSSETNILKVYENAGGTIVPLPSTTWGGHRVYRFSNGNFAIQAAQQHYANLTLAKTGAAVDTFDLNPVLVDATFMGWWFIESIATNTGNTQDPPTSAFAPYTLGMQGESSIGLAQALIKGNNLSDLPDASVARTQIGLATTANQTDSTDKRFMTDAQETAVDTIGGKLNELLDGTPNTDHSANGPQTDTFNAGATIAAGEVVYMGTGGKWLLGDASVTASAEKDIAVALEAGTDTNPLLVGLPGSFIRDDTWAWTAGDTLYLSLTSGDLSASVVATATDEVSRVIGYAYSATVIRLAPQQGVVHV